MAMRPKLQRDWKAES